MFPILKSHVFFNFISVLRHESKMYQFLNCLNSCYRSSLVEIFDCHLPPPVKPLNNHSTVADGIYHFLNILFSKASDCEQKMIVLCGYLSSNRTIFIFKISVIQEKNL